MVNKAIEIDEDRVEKQLPGWAAQLIYALDNARKGAETWARRCETERDEARQRLATYQEDTTGPADSDTYLEREPAQYGGDATPLGLGKGAEISFHAPALQRGDEAPSIQARIIDDRLVLKTAFGELSITTTRHDGVIVTIA